MGRGNNDSTLRIDEPLHFMFLVAYLITYFCCAYLLFICFKHCRRIWRRKPSRPTRTVRNVADLVNNLHRQQPQRIRQFQLTIQEEACTEFGQQNNISDCTSRRPRIDQPLSPTNSSDTSDEDVDTNTSRISPSPVRRLLAPHLYTNPLLLPNYDSISLAEDGDSPPPSYDECVLSSSLPDNKNIQPPVNDKVSPDFTQMDVISATSSSSMTSTTNTNNNITSVV